MSLNDNKTLLYTAIYNNYIYKIQQTITKQLSVHINNNYTKTYYILCFINFIYDSLKLNNCSYMKCKCYLLFYSTCNIFFYIIFPRILYKVFFFNAYCYMPEIL